MDNSKDNLFRFVEYSPENAERTGYSNYSYWGSVFRNFIKKKSAVAMLEGIICLRNFLKSLSR